MVEINMAIALYVFFVGLGGFVVYTIMKFKSLEKAITMFPTPEELAKEVIKVKLPISDLPPGALSKLKQFGGFPGMPPMSEQPPKPPDDLFKKSKKNYIG